MDATPQPVGHAFVVKQLQHVIFIGIEGAAMVRPKGYMLVSLGGLLGWLGPLLTVHTTDPLPATHLYIAVTPEDVRIFSKPALSTPFEIGRWKKGSFRASIPDDRLSLKLDLELERLGRVRLVSGLRVFVGSVRAVFDLVVQSASGPVTQA